ncbi:hypothetical protein ANN_02091 [Periplaneta americana]|uniref:Tc1-like transposase DDE domain-containing protein n=1 Tax=Periplaneta americana TaxID=6978 RepID=A0ABQ8TYA5_PERAM|nr:hypothetical protein ANN_02091 [Periplaneta americana]
MTVERHQQFGGSILFWAGVMFGRRTPLVSIEGNMTAAVYENNILQPIVSGFAETVGEGFTLQDDNARPHRAHSVQRYLVEHGIRRMDWPACSPDMNCIEHAWSFLRRAISNRPHHPLTIQELRNAALEEWVNLPQESLDALVLSMPRRIQECLRVRGGPTHYIRSLAENPDLNLENPVFIMKMHSVIHNQLSAPVYRPMLQYSWQSAGYVNPEQVSDFKNVIQVAFDCSALECGSADCSDGPFRRYVSSSSVSLEPLVILALRCAVVDGRGGGAAERTGTATEKRIIKGGRTETTMQDEGSNETNPDDDDDDDDDDRLRVFENKVLRKIFGSKRDEVTGEWRKLHNAELHALYSSPDIIRNIKSRRLRWAGHVARMGESRNAYREARGEKTLGRPRHRWEDNIKMDLREVGYDDREWINLAQDRDQRRAYVRAAMNLWVP